jgi:hypothetical protein
VTPLFCFSYTNTSQILIKQKGKNSTQINKQLLTENKTQLQCIIHCHINYIHKTAWLFRLHTILKFKCDENNHSIWNRITPGSPLLIKLTSIRNPSIRWVHSSASFFKQLAMTCLTILVYQILQVFKGILLHSARILTFYGNVGLTLKLSGRNKHPTFSWFSGGKNRTTEVQCRKSISSANRPARQNFSIPC